MTKQPKIEMIPVGKIKVLNPRARGKKKYDEIVASIADVGLKRPITVSRRIENKGITDTTSSAARGGSKHIFFSARPRCPPSSSAYLVSRGSL